MSDHFQELQIALSEATVRRYGAHESASLAGRKRAWSPRRPLRWPAVAAGIVAVLTASAAVAVAVLSGGSSAPLSGTVPGLRLLHYDVPLTPDLEAGDAGWCSSPRFSINGVRSGFTGGGSCFPAYRPGTPVIVAAGEPLSNARELLKSADPSVTKNEGGKSLFWAVVTPNVAALRLSPGHTVAARSEASLPGWKVVVAFTSGQTDPVALDLRGHALRPPSNHIPVLARAQARNVRTVARSPALCAIGAPHLAAVSASWGVIATSLPSLRSSVEANVLFSCIRTWYSIRGYTEAASAAILLSARNPARTAPELPGLTATSQPGVFSEDGGAAGPILAKRVGRAWLVVQGPSIAIDHLLLSAVRPHLPPAR
jgi:hypothetical protein